MENNFKNNLLIILKNFSISNALDIIVISLIIYGIIRLVRETRAAQLVKGILILMFAWFISYILEMRMLGRLLNNLYSFGILALMILFQPELRRALEQLGRGSNIGKPWSGLTSQARLTKRIELETNECISCICEVCSNFSSNKVGALIVFERLTKLGDFIDTGVVIDAKVSKILLNNIFFNKAPLHDGAVVIRDNLIHAAGCILPLTKNDELNYNLGTRHRAAIGISEISDAIVVVVSEETGTISLVTNGVINRNISKAALKKKISQELLPQNTAKLKKIKLLSNTKKGGKKHE